jgi:hypothetical protein
VVAINNSVRSWQVGWPEARAELPVHASLREDYLGEKSSSDKHLPTSPQTGSKGFFSAEPEIRLSTPSGARQQAAVHERL